MEYQELHNEYASLLQDKANHQSRLASLKDGYISTKTISGKKYTYLQYRVDGKLSSDYVREDHLPEVRAELDERADILEKIRDIDRQLEKIEAAANILNDNLRRTLVTLRRCAAMEAMPSEERIKSLAFGSAMTALEGIPASKETEKNLSRWVNGDISFQEIYLNTLRAYHLAEV
jgi:hypothetical protein